MSANSVSPPSCGTASARSREALAGLLLKELSLCQIRLPLLCRKRALPTGSMRPSGPTFDAMKISGCAPSTAVVCRRSRGPKRRLKAMYASSSRCWAGKINTAYSCHAVSRSAKALAERVRRSILVTVAPRVAWVGWMSMPVSSRLLSSRNGAQSSLEGHANGRRPSCP